MKQVLFLFCSLISILNAQNYFPYKLGDAAVYLVDSYELFGSSHSYYIEYYEFNDSLIIIGKKYIKNYDVYYSYYDSLKNILYSTNQFSGVVDSIDFNCTPGEQVYTILQPYCPLTVQPLTTETILNQNTTVFTAKYTGANYDETLKYADNFGICFLYTMSNYGPGMYSCHDYTLKQIRLNGTITPDTLLNIGLGESLNSTVYNFTTGSHITLKSTILPSVHCGNGYKAEVILVDKDGNEKHTATLEPYNNNHRMFRYYPPNNITTLDTIKYRFKGNDLGLNHYVVYTPAEGYATKVIQNITSIEHDDFYNLENYSLSQNYPNPFNPETSISYNIADAGNVKLIVYNQLGQLVATLVNEYKISGRHSVKFNAENLPSGIYYYTIATNNFTDTKKMVLIK